MSGHKPWSEISAKLRADPERRARIEQREQAIEAELTISQLREALGATQESVAERMNVTQSNVSHFERNPNIFLFRRQTTTAPSGFFARRCFVL